MNWNILLLGLCLSLACSTTKVIQKETKIIEKETKTVERTDEKTESSGPVTIREPYSNEQEKNSGNSKNEYQPYKKSKNTIRAWITVRNGIVDDNIHFSKPLGDMDLLYIESGVGTSKIYTLSKDGRVWVFEAENKNGDQIIYGYEQK